VLGRALDDSHAPEVRRHLTELTVSRMVGSACYRYTAPFVATIARGLDVSLQDIGVAIAIVELFGLLSPLIGRVVDRMSRRMAMTCGLIGVAVGAALAAATTGLVMFTIALIVINQSKALFDLSMGAWIIDHTPFEMRSRVIGLNETSWAAALLLGVSTMGLITAAVDWRAGFAAGGIAAAVCAAMVWSRVSGGSSRQHDADAPSKRGGRVGVTGWFVVAATLTMTAGAHCIVITFGSWLEDDFDFQPSGIAAVVFGLGLVELTASITSARRTDTWGKERSTMWGVALMVPGAIGLMLLNNNLALGLLSFGLILLGFEFAIVSVLGLGEYVVPGAPGRGLGLLFAAGTFGRALVTVPATSLYEGGGIGHSAALAAAVGAVALMASWRLERTAQP
jgi:predicted MFS family arabinose efflux permease